MISVDWRARHLPRLHGVRVQPVPLLWGGARPRPLPPLLLQGRLWDGGGPHGGTGNPLGLLAPRGSLRSANPPTDLTSDLTSLPVFQATPDWAAV